MLAAVADLGISKDNGASELAPGAPVTYQITVSNPGPSHAANVRVEDYLPEALSAASWTCAAVPDPGLLAFLETQQDNVAGVDGLAGASAVAASADGGHVYAAGAGESAVAVFARDPRNGLLEFVGQVRDGVGGVDGLAAAAAVALSGDGSSVYVAGELDDAVAAFLRDPDSGELDFVELERDGVGGVNGLGGARDLAVSPDGAHLYVAGAADSAVAVFARSSGDGSLSFLQVRLEGAGGVSGIAGASALALSPDGSHLYVAGESGDSVAVFARDLPAALSTWSSASSTGPTTCPRTPSTVRSTSP